MVSSTSRRDFLRAGFMRVEVMRPYGAARPGLFERLCDGCGDCVTACPEDIVLRAEDGKVRLDLSRGECTFCEQCIVACPTGALNTDARAGWDWVAKVGDSCLAQSGVSCRACEDFCEERAIRFRLAIGGRALPEIDEVACTGCGACAAPCPANAIGFARMTPDTTEHREATA